MSDHSELSPGFALSAGSSVTPVSVVDRVTSINSKDDFKPRASLTHKFKSTLVYQCVETKARNRWIGDGIKTFQNRRR